MPLTPGPSPRHAAWIRRGGPLLLGVFLVANLLYLAKTLHLLTRLEASPRLEQALWVGVAGLALFSGFILGALKGKRPMLTLLRWAALAEVGVVAAGLLLRNVLDHAHVHLLDLLDRALCPGKLTGLVQVPAGWAGLEFGSPLLHLLDAVVVAVLYWRLVEPVAAEPDAA